MTENAEARPEPPLSIHHAGERYVLTSFSLVRQNTKQTGDDLDTPFEVVTETSVDVTNPLSSGYTTCNVRTTI